MAIASIVLASGAANVPVIINDRRPVLYVASDWELRRIKHAVGLAVYIDGLLGRMSRRAVPDHMARLLFDFEGRALHPNGSLFAIHDGIVDDAFNNDGSFRWLSDFARKASVPMRQRPHRRLLGRLRVIDLCRQIERMNTASSAQASKV